MSATINNAEKNVTSVKKAEAVVFLKTVLSEFRDAETNGSVYYADDVYEELSRYADKTVALDSLGIRLYDDSDLPATAVRTFKIEKKAGDAVSKGDTVIIIEAMKMEIPIVAPQDGTVASIDCSVGDPVEAGAVLATMN